MAAFCWITGCSRSPETPPAEKTGSLTVDGGQTATGTQDAGGTGPRVFQPVVLGGTKAGANGNSPLSDEQRLGSVREALDPLQILVGQWRGITFRKIAGAVSVEQPEWIWDFQTRKDQPALVMVSDTSPYLKEARLTYLVDKECYQLTATDKNDMTRLYEGRLSQPVKDVPGDNNKLQRTFELELTQVEPADLSRLAKVVIRQQENNRYLFEVYDRRGDNFAKYDTVAHQRDGTSFAASLDDYGEKTCIISQGLGTIAVSHNGKTYWVCCTGCKAAFEDDPERWIAKLEAGGKSK